MRKWIFFLLYVLFLLPVTASAHSGGTDASGGHWNHSTGTYHYHHGYSAHQHTDMDGDGEKDCPYEFDDNRQTTPKYRIDFSIPTMPEITEPTLSERSQEIINNIQKSKDTDNSGILWGILIVWVISIPNILYFRYKEDKLFCYLLFVGVMSVIMLIVYLFG